MDTATVVADPMQHSDEAAKWLRSTFHREVGAFGTQVAYLLDCVWFGIYHLDARHLERIDWSNEEWIQLTIYGELATFDSDRLTRLVVTAHDLCIRVSIEAATHRYLWLMFHPREREGRISNRHPTMEQAIISTRRGYR